MTLHQQRALALSVLLVLAAAATGCEEKTKTVQGKALLSAELQKTLKPTAVLYIIARHPGEVAGPPLAVKRFPAPLLFPVDYMISEQDMMMPGTAFEGTLALTARVSQSGSAMPVSAGDIEGFPQAKFVPIGAKNVDIELNQVRK
jgi:hypothetical protein